MPTGSVDLLVALSQPLAVITMLSRVGALDFSSCRRDDQLKLAKLNELPVLRREGLGSIWQIKLHSLLTTCSISFSVAFLNTGLLNRALAV